MKTLQCELCHQPFLVKPYREAKAKYCSYECRDKAYAERVSSFKHQFKPQVMLICPHCQTSFMRHASRLQHGRGKYCSTACQYAATKARPKTNQVSLICVHCQQPFVKYHSHIAQQKGGGKYCSRLCRDLHRAGTNHPQYLTGEGQEKRGPNWQAQRRKALRRDQRICQHCDADGTDVHHIVPFRLFGLERYIEANRLTNLITLCEACHRKADADIQRAERVS